LAPPPEPVDQTLLVEKDTGEALDPGITFGDSYEYRAQRVARIAVDGRTVELAGEISPTIRVDALDVFPPAVPTGLAAVATAGVPASIDLNWEPDTEQDLAGYFVYRREDETPWRRISGEKPVAGPGFHDADVLPGRTYRYGVSAVDRGGHESGRSAEAQETVPAP
jgi:fibronectin type 3 domain-containing protein